MQVEKLIATITSMKAFELMKEIMGDKLEYVHTGEEIKMSHFTF